MAMGELFIISPTMLKVAVAAARTLTLADVATRTADDRPAPRALLGMVSETRW